MGTLIRATTIEIYFQLTTDPIDDLYWIIQIGLLNSAVPVSVAGFFRHQKSSEAIKDGCGKAKLTLIGNNPWHFRSHDRKIRKSLNLLLLLNSSWHFRQSLYPFDRATCTSSASMFSKKRKVKSKQDDKSLSNTILRVEEVNLDGPGSTHDSIDELDLSESVGDEASRELPQPKPVATRALKRVACTRLAVLTAFFVSACTGGVLSYVYASDMLEEDDENAGDDDDELLFGMGLEILYPLAAAAMLVPVGFAILLYDCAVRRAIRKLTHTANKNTAIVNNLFPENVRGRMLHRISGPANHGEQDDANGSLTSSRQNSKHHKRNNVRSEGRGMLSDAATKSDGCSTVPTFASELIPHEILNSKVSLKKNETCVYCLPRFDSQYPPSLANR